MTIGIIGGHLLLGATLILASGILQATGDADLAFVNAKVYTLDARRPWAEAVAIKDGAILAVGSNAEIRRTTGPQSRTLDLRGRLLLPGFIDGHNHYLSGAYSKRGVKLNGSRDKAELLARVGDYIRAYPGLGLYAGYGWSQSMMGDEKGTRQELDRLAADRPIVLFNDDTHVVWFNTKAMEMGGLSPTAPDPTPSSGYTRAADGTLAGIAAEAEAWQGIALATGILGGREMLEGIAAEIFPRVTAAGITAVHDMAIWAPDLPDGYRGLDLVTDLERAGRLPFRVVGVLGVRNAKQPAEPQIATLKEWSLRYRTPLVQVTGLKIWAEGTPDGQHSVLLEPYADKPDTRGKSDWTAETLAHWIALAYGEGFDVHIHTIGDGSVRRALDAFQAVESRMDTRGRRPVLHHINIIHPDDLPRFKPLGMGGNATLEWLVTYWDAAGGWLGEPRRQLEYDVWKRLIDQGVVVSFGSDIPGTDPDELAPLYQMQIATTGRIPGAPHLGAPPRDRVPSLEQMIYGYTMAGAYQMRLEDRIGSIEPGKLADLILLDRDLFTTPPAELGSVRVLMTMMNGRLTHLAAPPIPASWTRPAAAAPRTGSSRSSPAAPPSRTSAKSAPPPSGPGYGNTGWSTPRTGH